MDDIRTKALNSVPVLGPNEHPSCDDILNQQVLFFSSFFCLLLLLILFLLLCWLVWWCCCYLLTELYRGQTLRSQVKLQLWLVDQLAWVLKQYALWLLRVQECLLPYGMLRKLRRYYNTAQPTQTHQCELKIFTMEHYHHIFPLLHYHSSPIINHSTINNYPHHTKILIKILEDIAKAHPNNGGLEILKVELDSLVSVKATVSDFLSRSDKLNILICNAGMYRIATRATLVLFFVDTRVLSSKLKLQRRLIIVNRCHELSLSTY